MLTLLVLNTVLHWFDSIYSTLFSFIVEPFTNIATYVQTFYIPQTILDMFSICIYFLPIGTIFVLFFLTFQIIKVKIFFSVLHVLSGGIFFNS